MAVKTWTDFNAAQDERSATETVCGVWCGDGPDGEAKYFLMPEEADDELIHETAFEIRHGTPMAAYDKWVRRKAQTMPAA